MSRCFFLSETRPAKTRTLENAAGAFSDTQQKSSALVCGTKIRNARTNAAHKNTPLVCVCVAQIVPGERGRRHVSGREGSVEAPYKPNRRVIAQRYCEDAPPEGKRYLASGAFGRSEAEYRQPERRHGPRLESGFDLREKSAWQTKGRVQLYGRPAQHLVSNERTLELECGIKRKPKGLERRNGVPERTAGDKSFAAVECTPGYFLQEGIIPGSCIDDHRRKDDSHAAHRPRPKHVTYEEKKRAEAAKNDLMDVAVLTQANEIDGKTHNRPRVLSLSLSLSVVVVFCLGGIGGDLFKSNLREALVALRTEGERSFFVSARTRNTRRRLVGASHGPLRVADQNPARRGTTRGGREKQTSRRAGGIAVVAKKRQAAKRARVTY